MILLLQANALQLPEANTPQIIFILLLIAGFILFLIVGSNTQNKAKTGTGVKTSGGGKKKTSRWAFRRDAQRYGLSKDQAKIIEEYAKNIEEQEYSGVLYRAEFRARFIERAVQYVDESTMETKTKNNEKLRLFRIRQILDGPGPVKRSKSTRRRRQKRRDINTFAYVTPLSVVEVGKGRRRKVNTILQKNLTMRGRMQDVSAGGCSVRTFKPRNKGDRVLVQFDVDGKKPVNAYARVVNLGIPNKWGRIMHLAFYKLSRQDAVRIYNWVYEI